MVAKKLAIPFSLQPCRYHHSLLKLLTQISTKQAKKMKKSTTTCLRCTVSELQIWAIMAHQA